MSTSEALEPVNLTAKEKCENHDNGCNANQLVVMDPVEPPPEPPAPSSQPPATNQTPPAPPATDSQPPTRANCANGGSKPAASTEASANLLDAVENPTPLEDTLRHMAEQNPDVQIEEARHIQVGAAVRLTHRYRRLSVRPQQNRHGVRIT